MRAACISTENCPYKSDTGYCGYTGNGCIKSLVWRREKTIWQTGYYCSECQAFFGKDYDMVQYFNYCPNCGAKMEE